MASDGDGPPGTLEATVADTRTELQAVVSESGPTTVAVERVEAGGAPARLGRYELGPQLGAGGMAVVYQGRDPTLDRELAIKLIRPVLRGPAAQSRLLREAQAMARLEHPCVVPIFDVGAAGDDVFIVMPLLGGGTLGQWIHAAPRPWREVLDRFVAAARGLAAAHAAGLVHRDFKPDNVLVSAAGDVRVGDFGLAHSDGPSGSGGGSEGDGLELTATGVRIGTPAYMSPEQILGGPVDARSDQFAFCVALWEGLYGERPFRIATTGPAAREPVLDRMLAAIRSGALGPVPASREVPAWLHASIVRGLSPEPAARWPSMLAWIDHVESRRRRRAQVGVALGVAAPVSILVAAVAVGATGGGTRAPRSDAPRDFVVDNVTRLGRVAVASSSPDGARLAFVTDGAVRVVSTARRYDEDPAGVVWMAHGAARPVLAWSPDGSLVASAVGGGLVLVPAGGGSSRPLTSVPASAAAFLGPDLVFSDGAPKLHLGSPSAAPSWTSCQLPGDVRHVAALAAAGGGHLAVIAELADRDHAILRVDRSCRELGRFAAPGWTSGLVAADGKLWYLRHAGDADDDDGERVLIAHARDGRTVEERRLAGRIVGLAGVAAGGVAYVVRADARWRVDELDLAGGPTKARADGLNPTEVKPSPDGATLAWIEDADRRALRIAAYEDVPKRSAPVATGAMTAAWSPDGQRVAAIIDTGGGHELRVLDRKGAVVAHVPVDGIELEDGLVWDRDDAVVATAADARNLVRIDLITGAATPMLDGRGTASEPEVAPDGTVAFLAARDGGGGEGVWLRDPRGKLSRLRAGLVSTLRIAWTATGDAVLVHDLGSREVWRFPRRGAGAALVTVPLLPGERLSRLFPALDGRVFARVDHTATDVVTVRPVP